MGADSISGYSESDTLIAAAVKIVNAYIAAGGSATIFSDVLSGDWWYDGVMYLFDRQIIQGQGDGTFGLQALLRFQLAILLATLDEQDCAKQTGFERIKGCIEYAVTTKGYMKGSVPTDQSGWSASKEWSSSVYVCREDTVVAILKQQQVVISGENTGILDRFSDGNQVSEDAKPYMAYAVSHGMIRGTSEGKLLPKVVEGNTDSLVSRPQLGVLVYRQLIGLDKSKMKDYADTVGYTLSAAEEVKP